METDSVLPRPGRETYKKTERDRAVFQKNGCNSAPLP